MSSLRASAAAVWVLLCMGADLLAKTEVSIQGMESKSEREVMALIGGRLHYVRNKPANSWRANDAAFLVQQVLRNDGYFSAEVTPVIVGTDRIVLKVDEGLRLSLGEVTIVGDGETEELTELFRTPFGSDTPFGAGSVPFRAEEVPKGLEFVSDQLKSEGYWDAEVSIREEHIDKQTGVVDIVVAVDRGERFKIGQPTVDSPDGRGVKRSATTWQPFIGKWATTENVNGLRSAMIEAFISRGYPDAEINMNRRLAGATYYPDFVIRLGTRVKLLDVHAEGLKRTHEERIDEIMEPLEGDWYDEAAMNEKIKKLLGTGAFSSVRLETYPVARKRIDATLHFQETRAKEITFAGGVDSVDGPLLRAKYTDRNFRGQLRGFSAGTEISARGVLGELKLTNPWWRGTDILRTHRLYSFIKAYDGYTTVRTGYDSSWKMDLTEHYSMDLTLGGAFVTVTPEGLPINFLGDTDYGLLNLRFNQTLDYRDNPVLPKSGWHLSFPMELGVAIGNETHPYFRGGVDGGIYFPLGDAWNLGIGGFAEWVFPTGDRDVFPIDLRLFNGGARSVRSFPERELGPSFGGDPFGGDVSWAVNAELTRKLTGIVSAVGFVDAGAVGGDYTGVREAGVEVAAGLGLRLDLPIGPVRLEYGHNLTQGPGEPSGTWHFAIGTTF